MAGSEVYTYNLTQELSKRHDISVFTRIENPFMNEYEHIEEKIGDVHIWRINKPKRDHSLEDKYLDERMDEEYRKFLTHQKPDIVHVQHLSHLSTNLPIISKEEFDIPVVFTIHDFWMFCIRGQLITPKYEICTGPSEEKCTRCLRYMHVTPESYLKYREHMAGALKSIDVFLAPSKFIRQFYLHMGIPESKIIYSPYGFKKDIIRYRKKYHVSGAPIRFGFVGRIIPVKGIHLLLRSFSSIEKKNGATLSVYGSAGNYIKYLENMSTEGVYFKGGFDNSIIDSVLEEMDVLVVPSIWYENAPLVIQEATLKGIPVITSNIGGMAELVEEGVNGFLFDVNSVDSLRERMEEIITNPEILNAMNINPENVRSIEEDAKEIERIYRRLSS